ncbi:sporulation-regulated protein 3 [Monosporozyma unispora]|nr:hypothetical protein C6P44_001474 [Kazachstania unispora]
MKQNLIQMSKFDIDYIPNMLPYLIDHYSKEYLKVELFKRIDEEVVKDRKEDERDIAIDGKCDTVIGLTNLLTQKDKIIGRTGLQFNIMIIGKPGIGKSTIIQNLFSFPCNHSLNKYSIDLNYQNNLLIKLNINEVNKFGSKINNSNNWFPLVNEIEEYKREYIERERQLLRSFPIVDNRTHVCLFVIEPYQVSEMELKVMKELSEVVNIIPVVNKIDILNQDEIELVKYDIERLLNIYGIVPCKNISNQEDYKHHFPFMISDKDISCLQQFLIDEAMMELIDGTSNEFEIEYGDIIPDKTNKGEKIIIPSHWWWKEPYLVEQINLQNWYYEQLQFQRGKFQEWINVLYQKQLNLNQELEDELDKIEMVRLECQDLETKLLQLKLNGTFSQGSPTQSSLNGNNSEKTLVVTNHTVQDNDSLVNGGYI